MTTEYIKTIFNEYLSIGKPKHALLLNGQWGSGKTYFWDKELKPIAETVGLKTIYVSLNGISKAEQLDHLIFIKMLPFLQKADQEKKVNGAKLFRNLADVASKYYLKSGIVEIFKGVALDVFDYSKYLICFDDLERCSLPVGEALGQINDFVEHKHLRTLILADETQLNKIAGNYHETKEKVIRRVLDFKLNPEDLVPQLLKAYEKNAYFMHLMHQKKDFLIELVSKYEQKNLRTIQFYLDCLEMIFKIDAGRNEPFITELLNFAAIISFEFKVGNLQQSGESMNYKDFDIIGGYRYSRFIHTTPQPNENEEEKDKRAYINYIYRTYLEKISAPYHFYRSIFNYIVSGYFDLDAFRKEIFDRTPESIPEYLNAYDKIVNGNFRELENEEFTNYFHSIIQHAKGGDYSIYKYFSLADTLYEFSIIGLIDMTPEQIDKLVQTGLTHAELKHLQDDREMEEVTRKSRRFPTPKLQKIAQDIRNIHLKLKKQEYVEWGNLICVAIQTSNLTALQVLFEQHKYNRDVFPNLNINDLIEALKIAKNMMLASFKDEIEQRYKEVHVGSVLPDDITPLYQIRDVLSAELITITEQPKKFIMSELVKTLTKSGENIASSDSGTSD